MGHHVAFFAGRAHAQRLAQVFSSPRSASPDSSPQRLRRGWRTTQWVLRKQERRRTRPDADTNRSSDRAFGTGDLANGAA